MPEYTWTIVLHIDEDSTPHDADCYTQAQKDSWDAGQWCYYGVGAVCTLTTETGARATFEGPILWGIDYDCPDDEGNFRPDPDDTYIREVAGEMWAEVDGRDGFPDIPVDALAHCKVVR